MTADIICLDKYRRSRKDQNMWEKFKAWLASPFQSSMSALDWFLFIGLLIVIIALWRVILGHLKEAVD